MKLLFLDIDGVLNGHEKHPDSPYTKIRPDCVQRLNTVIKETDCRVVISSAWRYMMFPPCGGYPPQMSLTGFRYLLATHGVRLMRHIIGYTVSDEEIETRGGQILQYVNDHQPERWAVVDDDPMAMELGKHAHRLVRTNPRMGLTDNSMRKLIRILGKV